MKQKTKISIGIILFGILVVILIHYLSSINIAVLNPKGYIAERERNLIVSVLLLSLVVVIPVFVALIYIIVHYRESNPKSAKSYRPEWDHSRRLETAWWLFPTALIAVLSVVSWQATHQLDPTRLIASKNPAITVQVVSLDWKWLFIYPNQNIATVNYLQVPVNTPINFNITSDAPMNSFWIPQLGGQIYAMAGMSTQLHLMASSEGQYEGSSSNISGSGFSGMKFIVDASSSADYQSWLQGVKHSGQTLDQNQYQVLSRPSSNLSPELYRAPEHNLYGKILMKYMQPGTDGMTMSEMNMTSMGTQ